MKEKEAAGPRRLQFEARVITTSTLGEGISRPKGNDLAIAISGKTKEKVEVERVGETGFRLKTKSGVAYIEDTFGEDGNGQRILGCRISAESLRNEWFRKALGEVLGCLSDEQLYNSLVYERIFTVPWSSSFYITFYGVPVLEQKNADGLWKARRTLDVDDSDLEAYLSAALAKKLPRGYYMRLPTDMNLYPMDGKALRGMVEQDDNFKEAARAANEVVEGFVGEAGRDADSFRQRIFTFMRTGGVEL